MLHVFLTTLTLVIGILLAMAVVKMNARFEEKGSILLVAAVFIILSYTTFYYRVATPIIYKQGQIDAINGTIKYELTTNSDSTKTWKLNEESE